MKQKPTGGSAFPIKDTNAAYYGMTLRDYFAAKAMQALIQAKTTIPDGYPDPYLLAAECGINIDTMIEKDDGSSYTWGELLAEESYEVADCLLKAREQ